MRTVNPSKTYQGLTFAQWKALLAANHAKLHREFQERFAILNQHHQGNLRLKVRKTYYE